MFRVTTASARNRLPHFGMRCLICVGVFGLLLAATPERRGIRGVVRDAEGHRLEQASVRIKATAERSLTNSRGEFVLDAPRQKPIRVTAWAEGYIVGGVTVEAEDDEVEIVLKPIDLVDDHVYQWIPPRIDRSRPREWLTRFALGTTARM